MFIGNIIGVTGKKKLYFTDIIIHHVHEKKKYVKGKLKKNCSTAGTTRL